MEKDFAMQAGLGWIGKNSLLITPQFGSYCLLGCLFIDLDLPSDTPMSGDVCDGCEICIRACPTDCINQNRTIQADRCISYQTIENPLEIPRYLTEKMDGWVFGCDICQMVCPENRKAAAKAQDISAAQKPLIPQSVKLSELESIHGDKFVEIFAGTPVTRVGFNNFQRNILNASSNQKKKQLSN
jgi:epoxyqueuosine reductase